VKEMKLGYQSNAMCFFFILKTGLIKAKESKACRKNNFPFYSTEVISVHIIPTFNIVQKIRNLTFHVRRVIACTFCWTETNKVYDFWTRDTI